MDQLSCIAFKSLLCLPCHTYRSTYYLLSLRLEDMGQKHWLWCWSIAHDKPVMIIVYGCIWGVLAHWFTRLFQCSVPQIAGIREGDQVCSFQAVITVFVAMLNCGCVILCWDVCPFLFYWWTTSITIISCLDESKVMFGMWCKAVGAFDGWLPLVLSQVEGVIADKCVYCIFLEQLSVYHKQV